MINGASLAGAHTGQALGAGPTDQTAPCFRNRLFVRKATVNLHKALLALGGRQPGQFPARHIGRVSGVWGLQLGSGLLRVEFDHLLAGVGRLPAGWHAGAEKSIQRVGGLVPSRNRVHNKAGASHHVASGSDARDVRHLGFFIGNQPATAESLKGIRHAGQVWPLADGKNDHIGWYNLLGAGDLVQIRPSIHKTSKVHLNTTYPCHPLPFHIARARHLPKRPAGQDLDAFFFRILDFLLERRHLLAALQAGHPHPGSAGAYGRLRRVQPHVSSPDYQHPLACHIQRLAQIGSA